MDMPSPAYLFRTGVLYVCNEYFVEKKYPWHCYNGTWLCWPGFTRDPFHKQVMSSWSNSHENVCRTYVQKYWLDQATILRMPWQLSCHGMCKICGLIWSVESKLCPGDFFSRFLLSAHKQVCEICPRISVTHWPLGDVAIYFKIIIFKLIMRTSTLGACCASVAYLRTSLMIGQYWFRYTKPLPEPDRWHHMASLGHNELTPYEVTPRPITVMTYEVKMQRTWN